MPPQATTVEVTDDGFLHITCPHCHGTVYVKESEVACAIFRHAVLKATGEGISPHASAAECAALLSSDAVRGCARPFRLSADRRMAAVCDYI